MFPVVLSAKSKKRHNRARSDTARRAFYKPSFRKGQVCISKAALSSFLVGFPALQILEGCFSGITERKNIALRIYAVNAFTSLATHCQYAYHPYYDHRSEHKANVGVKKKTSPDGEAFKMFTNHKVIEPLPSLSWYDHSRQLREPNKFQTPFRVHQHQCSPHCDAHLK